MKCVFVQSDNINASYMSICSISVELQILFQVIWPYWHPYLRWKPVSQWFILPFSSYSQLNISSILLLLLILLVVRIEWLQCKCKACWPMLERYRHTDLWAIVHACTNYICRYLNSIWQTCKWLNVHAAVRTITVQYQHAIMSQQDKSLSVYHLLLEITHTKSLFQYIKIKNLLAAPIP